MCVLSFIDLIQDPRLPLLYWARCHTLLSTDNENPFSREHAKKAVRILDEDCRAEVPPEDFPEHQLEEVGRLLRKAQDEIDRQEQEQKDHVDDEGDAEDKDHSAVAAEDEAADAVPSFPPNISKADELLLKDATNSGTISAHEILKPGTSARASPTRGGASPATSIESVVPHRSSRCDQQTALKMPKKMAASKDVDEGPADEGGPASGMDPEGIMTE